MPVYLCIRGECDDLALDEPGVFTVKDLEGRNWTCYTSDEQTPAAPADSEREALKQTFLRQREVLGRGGEVREVACESVEALHRRLGEPRPVPGLAVAPPERAGTKRQVASFSVACRVSPNSEADAFSILLTFRDGGSTCLDLDGLDRLRLLLDLLRSFQAVEYDEASESLTFGPAVPGQNTPVENAEGKAGPHASPHRN